MKNILFILITVLICQNVFAEDIIYATVLEASNYKGKDLPDSFKSKALYNIPANEISLVLNGLGIISYEDKTIKLYNRKYYDVDKAYYIIKDNILYISLQITNYDSSDSLLCAIDLISFSILWNITIKGFNLTPFIIDNNYIYIAAILFLGKINRADGKIIWKYNDLYYKYKVNSLLLKIENNQLFCTDKNKKILLIFDVVSGKLLK